MTAIDDARSRLRDRKRKPAKPREPWSAPGLGDFLHAQRVLSYDATLTHCGVIGLTAWPDRIEVWARRTINPATPRLGYLATWDKAMELRRELEGIERDLGHGAHCVVEAPPVGGGFRTESSLIAGLQVVSARPPGSWTAMVPTHVSAVLLGKPGVRSEERKRLIRAAVIALVPEASGRDWNEHQRDALATGLTWLYDEARRRPQPPWLERESR